MNRRNESCEPGSNVSAEQVASYLASRDLFSELLGIRLERVAEGYALVRMEIEDKHLNGHGICHGGAIFSLADTAFAYACNSRNEKTVALDCSISFTRALEVGSIVFAEAIEKNLGGRIGIYDIEVRLESALQIALFRGTSYRIGDAVVG